MLIPTVLSGILAVMFAAALTPLVRVLALRLGAVDAPGERRVHQAMIPRMGGMAIAVGYTAALGIVLSTSWLDVPKLVEDAFVGYIAGAFVIFLAGAYDDIKQLGAKRKLFAQWIGATAAFWGGARIHEVLNVPGLGEITIGPVLAYVATVVWILAFTNAINLVDGLDGLAGGIVFFASLTNLIVAIMTGNVLAASLNAALAGAVLGFLFYNFNPAKIFMGDTGSLFLGYALSAGALLTARQKESTLAALLVPFIALGLPLTDTVLAMVRRMLARRSIFAADRSHLHHKLLELGLTHRRAVLTLYAGTVALSGFALLAAFGQDWQIGLALVASIGLLAGTVRVSGMFGRSLRPEIAGAARALGAGLPEFLLAMSQIEKSRGEGDKVSGLNQTQASLTRLFQSACESAEVRTNEGWQWVWEGAPSKGRADGALCRITVDIPNAEGEPIGTLKLSCRTLTPTPPPELVLLAEIVARALRGATHLDLKTEGR